MDIASLQDAFREDPTQSVLVLLLGAAVAFGASQLLYWFLSESAKPVPIHVKEDLDEEVSASQHKGITSEIQNGKIYPKCPADGRFLSTTPITPATPTDIDNAIANAAAAQKDWARTTFAQRRQFLATLLQYVNTHQDSIVRACCLDSGKTKIDASFGEILVTVEKLQWTINHGEAALLPSSRSTNLLMCYKRNTIVYEPLGVVAACFSWNYPFHSWISNVISALFSGNAIVLKPSEQTCWSSQYFHRITSAALTACGHSPDLVQNLVCLPDTADYLTSHPGISHITFIGSRTIAHKVCSSAAKSLTPVCVELGGKDPAIVLDDRKTIKDIDSVVSILMRGTFQSAGQNCIGIERIIALPAIYDLLVSKMESKIKNLRLGSALDPSTPDTIDMGAMISSASFSRLTSLVQSAVQAGATLHHGGTPYRHPSYPNGTYFTPTLLSNVPPTSAIAQQELFAPVCLIFRAENLTHALSLANGTEYGLGASVFGHDRPSIERVVREIKSGMISVNDFGSYYACSMPFGGIKGSGYGRFSGAEGLQALCNPKSVCEDAPWARMLGIKTEIPPILQYPVKGIRGWEACKGIIGTGYGIGLSQRVGGLTALLGALMRSGSAQSASQTANGHAKAGKQT